MRRLLPVLVFSCCAATWSLAADLPESVPAPPKEARLVFTEDWSSGQIDPQKWYVLRKKWGGGNHGVVPENVSVAPDDVHGETKNVLVCTGHGDQYDGDVVGMWGRKDRVGGVIVSKPFFASGRIEIVAKVGEAKPYDGGPENPREPSGAIPAMWTYGYRWVHVSDKPVEQFVADKPMYNPHMKAYGLGANEYWSELDFPEFGKGGDFSKAMYNTFCQSRHEPLLWDVSHVIDGDYHTYVTEWRTKLKELPSVTDAMVAEQDGYYWIQEKSIPFDDYLGNPLKRLGPDRYAVYTGDYAVHYLDGKKIAENHRFVPAMAAQLNLGIWLPDWAGPAPWKTASIKFASVKVWQYDDPGDVRGVIVDDLKNNMDEQGREIK
ncbi:glycoside hydrolase family 16 protein [Blastopirellula sp. JC732]|uniref:Glycoside hydrolase family 16 protein n=1 Tax=Blastopirellula sediminis TaxID=2894196 RepID=A0A9X1MNS1_9BACT|nr:glycoside hydrolase family 16 protein [Blastopirellula sediminis]MCC9607065.1 glycoside hydrolase family 16 protein [Blastopirellula sediminis]MCC9629642.1 glycoside hydrolase family 16 protein [Blastopirellula sediminis]